MRFWLGLLVGVVLGAAATWLVITRPWGGRAAVEVATVADAGAAAEGKTGRRKKVRKRARGTSEDESSEAPPPVLSASDRASVWRGPTISLPARTLDLGDGDDARPLDAGEINDVIARSSGPMLACIEQARAGAELQGEVRLEMLVGGNGSASKVRVGAPRWFVEHGLVECAVAAARRMRFPATGAPTVVDVPYHLD